MRVMMTEVYRDWINDLKDRAVRARIQVRVEQQDIKVAIALAKNL